MTLVSKGFRLFGGAIWGGIAAPLKAAIIETTDAPDSIATPYMIAVGDTFDGTLDHVGDRDRIAINLAAGATIGVTLDGVGLTPLSDPFLRLYDSAGLEIAFNDDGGAGFNAALDFTASTAGTYYIGAGAFSDNFQGQYSLGVTGAAVNTPPQVTAVAQTLSVGAWALLSTAVSATDAEGDAITQYEVRDTAGTHSFWVAGGYVDATAGYVLPASDFSTAWYQGDVGASVQTLEVRASDATGWGAWGSFTLTTDAPNTPPVATLADQITPPLTRIDIGARIAYSDADGDAAALFEVWDSAGGNSFWLDGTGYIDASAGYVVSAVQIAGLWLEADAIDSTQTLWVRANDGTDWGAWDRFSFHSGFPNQAPVVAVPDQNVAPGQWTRLSNVVSVTDPDGDIMAKFQIWDSAGGNNWWADNGVVDAAAGYTTTNLGGVWFQGDAGASSQTLWVRANDGTVWSAWDRFNLTTHSSNTPPVASVLDQTVAPSAWTYLTSVLSVTDPDGDPVVLTEIWDSVGTGNWWADGGSVDASAGYTTANLAGIRFQGDAADSVQTLWLRVNDGQSWSVWESFDLITGAANRAPAVAVNDLTIAPSALVALAPLINYSDADGDPAALFEVWDGAGTNNFRLDGTGPIDATSGFVVSAADLALLRVEGDASASSQTLWVRAHDGTDWGAWDSFLLITG